MTRCKISGAREAGTSDRTRIIRPRTIIYVGVLVLVAMIMLTALVLRSPTEVNVIADRNPLFVQLSNGDIRNGFTVKILNKGDARAVFDVSIDGLEGAVISRGLNRDSEVLSLDVPADSLETGKFFVQVPREKFDQQSNEKGNGHFCDYYSEYRDELSCCRNGKLQRTSIMSAANSDKDRKSFELTGKHVLIGFVLFFGLIFASNAVMISLAVKTFPGLQSKSAYKAGRNYNEQIEQANVQQQLGWRTSVEVDEEGTGAPHVRVVFHDKYENPLSDLTVTGTLQRTVHSFDDVVLEFNKRGNGIYEVSVDGQTHRGQWRLKIEAVNRAGDTFQIEQKVYIAP